MKPLSKLYKRKSPKIFVRKQQEQKRLYVTEHARIFYESLPPCPENFPYFVRKKVHPCFEIKYDSENDAAAIPIMDVSGRFCSIQWIYGDGTKRFHTGTSPKGGFFGGNFYQIDEEHKDVPILIGEGVATMLTIANLFPDYPFAAALSCGQLSLVSKSLKEKYPNHKIIIMADNDHRTKGNPGLSKAVEAYKSLKLTGVIYPNFSRGQEGTDWNDFYQYNGEALTYDILSRDIGLCCMPKEKRIVMEQVEEYSAGRLLERKFKPIKWAVEDFLPSGLSILAGGPKIGKSILALHISLAVATGGYAFGKIKVDRGQVLYLALEDNPRRLQERIEDSGFEGQSWELNQLTLATNVPRQHEGGLSYIRWWLECHGEARLVIIDTLQRFRKQLTGKNSMYSEDYDTLADIKKLADEFDVPFLIIHHLKKAASLDWLNQVSGSQGIAGAADSVLVLERERTSSDAILHRTGRDVEEKDFTLELDQYSWVLGEDVVKSTTPEWKQQILDYLKEHNTATPKEMAMALSINPTTLRKNLQRLIVDSSVVKKGFGTYALA